MKLFELDPNNPIDRELDKTAKDAAKDGSMDPNDIDAQADDPMGDPMGAGMDDPMAEPDPAMGDMPEEPEEEPAKPVDSALLARVHGHDYLQNYSHDDPDKPSHPSNILGMEADELSQLRDRIRGEVQRATFSKSAGTASTEEQKARNEMLAFVELIMMHKKKKAKDDNTSKADKPRVREQPKSKTESGKQFKAKRF